MSTPNLFWFHCGRCGSLFQSHIGDTETRLCPKCGADPSPVIQPPPIAPRESPPPVSEPEPEPEHRGKRTVKKRRNRHFMFKLVGGWTLLLALIVFGARTLWPEDTTDKRPATNAAPTPTITDEDLALLKDGGQKCTEAFSGFLAAGTPEERNQFVLTPVSTASRMARFYSLNPLANLDPATLSLEQSAVLHLPGGTAIETLWNSQNGRKIDAVFREEEGEWKLDWDHYARYSDYPWSLFLAGSGAPEGEFRLLARERLAEERKDADTISIVLYAPRFGHPGDVGFQSPEFLVSRASKDGQLLDAAFKQARGGKPIFDSKLPNLNPDGMIRVRVKIKRTEVNMERKFEITGVTACHWYSVDDPGVEPAKPAEEKSAAK